MSNVRRSPSSIPLALMAFALLAPSAQASGRDLWIECRDTGTVGANHSPQDYADAIAGAVADTTEYTGCLAAIKAAQQQAALGGTGKPPAGKSGTKGRDGNTPGSGDTRSNGAPRANADRVTPTELGAALATQQVDPAAQPEATPDAAPAVDLGGDRVQLGAVPSPSIARTLSLPLPLAAAALVVLLSAALPVARAAASRFGS